MYKVHASFVYVIMLWLGCNHARYIHRPFNLSMVLRLKWSSLIKIRHGVKFWLMSFEYYFDKHCKQSKIEINQCFDHFTNSTIALFTLKKELVNK